MKALIFLLNDYTFQTVALGSALLGLISGVLGSFAVLRRQSLLGDGVSHSALPGVVLAFILLGSKNTEILLLGALASGLLATLLIVGIVRYTRIKFDSALALVMSVFFGLGLVLLSYVQKIPNANQAGLKRFIFGQASTLLQGDIILMAVCGTVLLALVVLFWKEFKLFTFDGDFAQSLGFSPQRLNLLLSFMIVLAIIIGLQTVGVILMSAMLIAPAVAARQWTNKLWKMVLLAAVFGAVSGVAGTTASSLAPKLPTGPAIVVCVSTIVVISVLFAPGRGVLHRLYRHRKNKLLLRMEGGAFHVPTP
ncbi:ABC-3 protein [Syntrophobotulus glycolicus DSM 8271]|uniref:ABC-3 protein n=1 Tax=Syntrophobotulus glycolicus (strain DSM 8271 / FlGlyR) TaxID=645991 RepID=F0SX17_SYNGF|nr:iron chelate uptake ABC transporter family permease subunit [Syntrophobotulus glycolicus]ADY55800.1 ABC-3 protein [Syntrophobotulus glycolicus DSM 8271]